MTKRELERTLLRFEGLIHETARQIVAGGVEMDFDDVQQRLRIKVWRAVVKHDERRRGLPLRRYVFMCLTDERKDLEKRPRRHNSSIEQIRERPNYMRDTGANQLGSIDDWFDSRYLSVDAEQVFAEVDEQFELPSTLTAIERRVIGLRLDGLMLHEVEQRLGLSRAQREAIMRGVREKLADWKPSRSQQAPTRAQQPAEPTRVPVAA